MSAVRYYVRRTADGSLAAAGDESGPTATLAAIAKRWGAGYDVLDAGTNPRPPASVDPLAPKRARLAALRAKGWAALTIAEKDEARSLAFDCGEPSPPAA